MKSFFSVVIGVVAVVIVGSLFIVGSPQTERLRRFDETRQNNLSMIQNELLYYRDTHDGQLPASLDVLNDDFRGFRVPVDPVSGEPYTYEIKSTSTIALCATFALSSDGGGVSVTYPSYPRYSEDNWIHPAGRHCFERTLPPYQDATKQKFDGPHPVPRLPID